MAEMTVFDGLRVVDLTHGFAGAITTMILADNGADVARVEPPAGSRYRGDPNEETPGRRQWHRSKRRLVADLNDPAGREGVRALIHDADVLVESFRPGVLERLGLGYDAVAARNPRLIYCSITGFGRMGRLRDLPGYEGIVMALSGWMTNFGAVFGLGRPAFTAVPMAGFGASQAALQGICAALHLRRTTGAGQRVETSLLQALTAYDMGGWFGLQMREKGDRFPELGRMGAYGYRSQPLIGYISARTKDGKWLQFANWASHLFWLQAQALGLGHLHEDPEFAPLPFGGSDAAKEQFWEAVLRQTAERTEAEWMATFLATGEVGADHMGTTQDGMDHPQVRYNGHVIAVHDPETGRGEQVGPLVRFGATPSRIGPPPAAAAAGSEAPGATASPLPGAMTPPPGGALADVTVVEAAAQYAAPFGPSLLVDLGARVIKVEPLGGDPMRQNGPLGIKAVQGKESIALDLKHPEAQQIVHRLVERADLFMHNYRPGVPARLGIDYETLRQRNERLVYLYAGAYGDEGPYVSLPAYHPIAGGVCGNAVQQAGAGFPPPEDEPLDLEGLKRVSLRLSHANDGNPDTNAALVVGSALMLGLVARDNHGAGQQMLTTMLCANAYAMSDDWIRYAGKPDRPLVDSDLCGTGPLYRLYQASEGWVFLACTNETEWRRLVGALGDDSLARDERFASEEGRRTHSEELAETLGRILIRRTADEWQRELPAAGVACVRADGPGFPEFTATEPAMRENGFIVDTVHPVYGPHWRHGPTVHLSATQAPPTAGTVIGQHTRLILQELGYDEPAIADLEARGVIRCG